MHFKNFLLSETKRNVSELRMITERSFLFYAAYNKVITKTVNSIRNFPLFPAFWYAHCERRLSHVLLYHFSK